MSVRATLVRPTDDPSLEAPLNKLLPAWLAALLAAAFVVSCSDDNDAPPTPLGAEGVTQVARHLLAEVSPDTAAGQLLQLTRAVIPAGQSIAPHTHPGPQLAVIVNGTLTYTVIDGEVTVVRAAETGSEKVETYSSGSTIELAPGDVIQESLGMVHEAINETDEIVIIYLSSLFPEGVPAASPIQ
jgi:quercetin dioxygenase-like cupin family protein